MSGKSFTVWSHYVYDAYVCAHIYSQPFYSNKPQEIMSTSSYVKIVIFNVRLHITCRFVYYAFWQVRTISEPMHMCTLML